MEIARGDMTRAFAVERQAGRVGTVGAMAQLAAQCGGEAQPPRLVTAQANDKRLVRGADEHLARVDCIADCIAHASTGAVKVERTPVCAMLHDARECQM